MALTPNETRDAPARPVTDADGRPVVVVRAAGWSVAHAPAANTIATVTRAAAAGVQHVCRVIHATLVAGTTAPAAISVDVVLRDGVTGVGAILWQTTLAIPAAISAVDRVNLPGLDIAGTTGNAMTLEFTAAGGVNTLERLALAGYEQ